MLFLKIGFKLPVSRSFEALAPDWFQVLNMGWTEELDHFKVLLRGVLMDPLRIVVDQVIKDLHNLKIIIKELLLEIIISNCLQFFYSWSGAIPGPVNWWSWWAAAASRKAPGETRISEIRCRHTEHFLQRWEFSGSQWSKALALSQKRPSQNSMACRYSYPVRRWPTGCASERLRSSRPKVWTGSTRWLLPAASGHREHVTWRCNRRLWILLGSLRPVKVKDEIFCTLYTQGWHQGGPWIPAGTWHISECMPTPYPWWLFPGSGSDPWSLSHECVQPSLLHRWHMWSCTPPERQPEKKNHTELGISQFVICAAGRSTNLLQLIEVVRLLDFELKDIQDPSVNVQHQCGHIRWSNYFPNDTVGVLKLDGMSKLRFQGWGQSWRWGEWILWQDAI